MTPISDYGFTPTNPPSNRISGGVWRGEPIIRAPDRALRAVYSQRRPTTMDAPSAARERLHNHPPRPVSPPLPLGYYTIEVGGWSTHVHTTLRASEPPTSAWTTTAILQYMDGPLEPPKPRSLPAFSTPASLYGCIRSITSLGGGEDGPWRRSYPIMFIKYQ